MCLCRSIDSLGCKGRKGCTSLATSARKCAKRAASAANLARERDPQRPSAEDEIASKHDSFSRAGHSTQTPIVELLRNNEVYKSTVNDKKEPRSLLRPYP